MAIGFKPKKTDEKSAQPEKRTFGKFVKDANARNERLRQLKNKNNPNGKSGGSNKIGLRMRYFRLTETPTWLQFVPTTKDEPFYPLFQSWATKVPVICNCKGGNLDVACVPCAHAVEVAETDETRASKMLPMRRDVITINDLRYFHKVKVRKGDAEYSTYEPCKGVNARNKSICENCDNNVEKAVGRQLHWSMGFSSRKKLLSNMEDCARRCMNCKTGFINPYAFKCKACGKTTIDLREDGVELSDEDVALLVGGEKAPCPGCDVDTSFDTLFECVKEDDSSGTVQYVDGCDKPVRAQSIWDLDYKISEVKGSSKNDTTVKVHDFRAKTTKGLADYFNKPMDFDDFFAFMDLAEQAKMMDIPNMYGDEDQAALEEHFKKKLVVSEDHTEEYEASEVEETDEEDEEEDAEGDASDE